MVVGEVGFKAPGREAFVFDGDSVAGVRSQVGELPTVEVQREMEFTPCRVGYGRETVSRRFHIPNSRLGHEGFFAWVPIPKGERRATDRAVRPSVLAPVSAPGWLPSRALSSARADGPRIVERIIKQPPGPGPVAARSVADPAPPPAPPSLARDGARSPAEPERDGSAGNANRLQIGSTGKTRQSSPAYPVTSASRPGYHAVRSCHSRWFSNAIL